MNSPYFSVVSKQAVDDELINFGDLFSALWRHRIFIICFTLAIVVLTAIGLRFIQPIYQATAVLQINKDQATQVELLKSRELMAKVASKLDLASSPEFNPEYEVDIGGKTQDQPKEDIEHKKLISTEVLASLMKGLNVEPVQNTTIVKVHFTSSSPKLAMDIANALVDQYITSYQVTKKAYINHALDRLQVSLAGIGETIGNIVGEAKYEAINTRGGLDNYIQEVGRFSDPRIVDHAVYPLLPVNSKKPLILIMATMLGAAVVIGVVLLRELLNNTLRSIKEVEELLGQPVLGILPNKSKILDLEVFDHAVKKICARLHLACDESSKKIYMVTSSAAGEGVSTVAISLARNFGLCGKTALIDVGSSEAKHSCEGAVVNKTSAKRDGIDHDLSEAGQYFDRVCMGPVSANFQDFLACNQLGELLRTLSQSYEYIVLDTSSLQENYDALLLNQYCHNVVYVVGAGQEPKECIARNFQQLKSVGTGSVGVVINKAIHDV